MITDSAKSDSSLPENAACMRRVHTAAVSAGYRPRTSHTAGTGRLIISSLVFLLLCTGFAFAQNQARPWWYTLEQGKLSFRNGDYGGALLAFEDARRQRRAVYEQMERDLIELLSLFEVRRLGDSLDRIEIYIRERHYQGAAAALEELYYRVPREKLNNSAAAALSALGGLKNYPEAEYWIGETYRAEGELGLALGQFQKAYEQRGLFENQDFDIELLYKIAGIRKARQEYNEMERVLLSILERDSLWSDTAAEKQDAPPEVQLPSEPSSAGQLPSGVSASFARQAMTRTLENDGIGRFLTLYRYQNSQVEEAHRLLGFYYYASGRHSRAGEHLMFAFLIQNTTIIAETIRRQYDFTFTGLEALAAEINRSPVLSSYADKTEYYKTAYYLGTSLFGSGRPAAARGFWTFLSTQPAAGEWRNRSLAQLERPHVERVIEMP